MPITLAEVRNKQVLRKFYEEFDPERIKNIEPMFQRWEHEYILEAIKKKYSVIPSGWMFENAEGEPKEATDSLDDSGCFEFMNPLNLDNDKDNSLLVRSIDDVQNQSHEEFKGSLRPTNKVKGFFNFSRRISKGVNSPKAPLHKSNSMTVEKFAGLADDRSDSKFGLSSIKSKMGFASSCRNINVSPNEAKSPSICPSIDTLNSQNENSDYESSQGVNNNNSSSGSIRQSSLPPMDPAFLQSSHSPIVEVPNNLLYQEDSDAPYHMQSSLGYNSETPYGGNNESGTMGSGSYRCMDEAEGDSESGGNTCYDNELEEPDEEEEPAGYQEQEEAQYEEEEPAGYQEQEEAQYEEEEPVDSQHEEEEEERTEYQEQEEPEYEEEEENTEYQEQEEPEYEEEEEHTEYQEQEEVECEEEEPAGEQNEEMGDEDSKFTWPAADDPILDKYKKMIDAGLPQGAVENGMMRDFVHPGVLFEEPLNNP